MIAYFSGGPLNDTETDVELGTTTVEHIFYLPTSDDGTLPIARIVYRYELEPYLYRKDSLLPCFRLTSTTAEEA